MARWFFSLGLMIFFPLAVFAANADLGISTNDMRFSKESLVAGETIRLYARIHNEGETDMTGYVTFFQGNVALGNSQVLSVLKNGAPEEVFIDFVVPASTFNIRAEIRGTEPTDTNTANDTAITAMLEPMQDGDADGISDGSDNCPSVANTDQRDADGDGAGNACDNDDDNDGVSDAVEAELGVDPLNADTDADGTADADDAYPNDPTLQMQPKPLPAPVKKVFKQVVAKVAEGIREEEEKVAKTEEVQEPHVLPLQTETLTFSPNAVFSYAHDRWNTFTFRVEGATAVYRYEWDFGDGVRSNKTDISHTYEHSGAFEVTLAIRDAEGRTASERATVLVPFFSLQNPMVLVLLLFLFSLLILGGWAYWGLRGKGEHVPE
ncbi:PKD domain-containing protein [Candidatus Parcubacteria bacterium]|nr:PKD domain-containing protein [Candidatus Parcubacteria bacterium]